MKKIIGIFLLLIIAGGAIVAYLGYNKIFGSLNNKATVFYINTNSTYEEVKQDLLAKELIDDAELFDLLAQKMNYPNKVYAGRYEIEEGTTYYDLLVKLRGGMQSPFNFVLNNVNFKEDFAGKVANQLEIDSIEVIDFLNNEDSLASIGANQDDILCYFIPNTYEMYWNTSWSSFLEKMQKEHTAFWNETRVEKAAAIGLTPNEVFVLASIVEKEYKFGDERQRIAGVYVNRIETGMKLQADPTVKYAIGDLGLRRVLNVHTEYDNPYNTYYYAGLPPGPICLPETATIDAVLNAEDHDYIYFCAKPDLSGYHEFNTTYSGHLATARLYQAALNKLEIYE